MHIQAFQFYASFLVTKEVRGAFHRRKPQGFTQTPCSENELNDEALEAEIRKEWSIFLADTLPKLDTVLKKQEWFR